jgi:hypothetical protein
VIFLSPLDEVVPTVLFILGHNFIMTSTLALGITGTV